MEAKALGHGGITLVTQATGLNYSTIQRGMRELDGDPVPDTWTRRAGGGRKRAECLDDGLADALDTLVDALDTLVEPHIRGDLMTPLK